VSAQSGVHPIAIGAARADPVRAMRGGTAVWILLTLTLASKAAAQTPDDAVSATVNPFPYARSLQLQPAYTDIHAGGNDTQLLVRLGIFYGGLFIPGIKAWDLYTFVRLEMYAESLNQPGSSVAGLQNWNGLWMGVKPFAWGATVAAGVNTVLPTSTNSALDSQEWQLGPALGAYIKHVKHLEIGTLVLFLFSVAGTTPDLAYVQVQPIVAYHLPLAFYFKTDPIWKFSFTQAPAATVPVNLHFGRGITGHTVVNGIVEYVTTGSGHGNVTVQLNFAYVNW
jgi:hypothetical protein